MECLHLIQRNVPEVLDLFVDRGDVADIGPWEWAKVALQGLLHQYARLGSSSINLGDPLPANLIKSRFRKRGLAQDFQSELQRRNQVFRGR